MAKPHAPIPDVFPSSVPFGSAVFKSIAWCIPLIMLPGLTVEAIAHSPDEALLASTVQLMSLSPKQTSSSPPSLSFELPPPPDTGIPSGRSRGGGSRQGCGVSEVLPPLTALTPHYELAAANVMGSDANSAVELQAVWSYTTQSHPTFWVYTPHELTGQTEVLFVLQDQNGAVLDSQTFYPQASPGIVSVSLANRDLPLEVGQRYKWSFQVYCAETPDFVEGWIYPVASMPSIHELSPVDQARAYANAGIWQDALTILANHQQVRADDAQVEWRSLLQSVGLDELAEQPFVDCCSIEAGSDRL